MTDNEFQNSKDHLEKDQYEKIEMYGLKMGLIGGLEVTNRLDD